jgi:hypothetical protein
LRIKAKGFPKPSDPSEGNDGSWRESVGEVEALVLPGLQGLAWLPGLALPGEVPPVVDPGVLVAAVVAAVAV